MGRSGSHLSLFNSKLCCTLSKFLLLIYVSFKLEWQFMFILFCAFILACSVRVLLSKLYCSSGWMGEVYTREVWSLVHMAIFVKDYSSISCFTKTCIALIERRFIEYYMFQSTFTWSPSLCS